MKILQLSDACGWSGGVEQFYLSSKELVKRGFDVTIGCNNKGRIYKLLKETNEIPCVDFYFEKEVSIKGIKEIYSYVKENKIDIIHAHHVKAHSLGLIVSLFLPNVVFITTRRVIFKIRRNPLSRYKYRGKRVDKIIAVSNAVKKVLIDAGVFSDKIEVIYSGVNLEKFGSEISGEKIRKEFNMNSDDMLIGKIANYSFYKGHDIFIKAAALVIKEVPNVKFMIIGENTKDNEKLTELASKLKVIDNFIFAGYRRDIPEIISAFDISVNSSRFEGLSGVIRESSAIGKPVIASAVGGNPEIIKDGETGYLTNPEDHNHLAECILKLIKNKDRMNIFGTAGRKFIKENFSIEVVTDKAVNLYEKLYKLKQKSNK